MKGPVLVIGKSGQLARSLQALSLAHGVDVQCLGSREADVRDRAALETAFESLQPVAVVNAGAFTDVDGAEGDVDTAFAVNATGAGNVAAAAARRTIPVIHISTDYVFDGTLKRAYRESDPVAPLGVYGRSKAAGERLVRDNCPAHWILRTAWLYSPVGRNFVRTMLRVGAANNEVRVVDDQTGTPTSAYALARIILQLCQDHIPDPPGQMAYGTYHVAGTGTTTWYGFACEIFKLADKLAGTPRPRVVPIPSAEWVTRAPRPRNSALNTEKIGAALGTRPPAWPDDLQRVMGELLGDGRSATGTIAP